MRYFRLIDDIEILGRWHLGEIKRGGRVAVDLCDGVRTNTVDALSVDVTQNGKPLEFSLTSFGVPVVETSLGAAISRVSGADVQLLPISVAGSNDYCVLNPTRLIACLDETRSEFTKWTSFDHRPDFAGQYRMVTQLYLDVDKIPPDVHIFLIEKWPVAMIVSNRLREAMLFPGCFGAKFLELAP